MGFTWLAGVNITDIQWYFFVKAKTPKYMKTEECFQQALYTFLSCWGGVFLIDQRENKVSTHKLNYKLIRKSNEKVHAMHLLAPDSLLCFHPPPWTFKSLFLTGQRGYVLWQNVRQLNSHGSSSQRWAHSSRLPYRQQNKRTRLLPAVLLHLLWLTSSAVQPDEGGLIRGRSTEVNFLQAEPCHCCSQLSCSTSKGGQRVGRAQQSPRCKTNTQRPTH